MLGDKEATQDGVTQGVFEGYGGNMQSLRSYATLASFFNLIFAIFVLVMKRTGKDLPERLPLKDIALLGIATHKVSTIGSNDAVTSPIRAPFTELNEKESPKSVDETPRGRGLQKSVGELLTCQFCLGMWVASIFTYGLLLAPRVTRLAASIFTVVTISDTLHQAYKALVNRA